MKDKKYWVENCNLTGVAEVFSQMFFQNMGSQFEGNINLLIFDRKITDKIAKHIPHMPFLDGWIPYKDNSKSPYDFFLTPEIAANKEYIQQHLKQVDPSTYSLITLNVFKKLNTMVVALVI